MAYRRGRSISRADARRGLRRGSVQAATGENFRHSFGTEQEAVDYVADIGFDLDADSALYAIVAMPVGAARWSTRRGWGQLSAAQQKRYRNSRQAQAEAELHGVDIETWYEVAPDVKAFRGHAHARQHPSPLQFFVFINRTTQGLPTRKRRKLSKEIRAALLRRKFKVTYDWMRPPDDDQ